MKKVNILTILFFALVIASCGSKDEEGKSKDKDKKENTKDGEGDNTSKSEEPEINKGNKGDCIPLTKLNFKGEEFELNDFTPTASKVTLTKMQSGDEQYESVFIVLANYGEGKVSGKPTEEGQVKLTMSFSAKAGERIEAGVYDAASEGFGKGANFSANYETKDKSHLINMASGSGEIFYVGNDDICGTVSIKSKSGKTVVEGNFNVER